MTTTINTKQLQEALQNVIKVVPTRSTLPILSCALFKFDETNHLTIRATNLETSINVVVETNKNTFSKEIAIPINSTKFKRLESWRFIGIWWTVQWIKRQETSKS